MMQWKQLKCPERLGAGERGGDAARAESGATSECGDLWVRVSFSCKR